MYGQGRSKLAWKGANVSSTLKRSQRMDGDASDVQALSVIWGRLPPRPTGPSSWRRASVPLLLVDRWSACRALSPVTHHTGHPSLHQPANIVGPHRRLRARRIGTLRCCERVSSSRLNNHARNAACRLHAVFGSALVSHHYSSAISNVLYRHKLH